MATWNSLRVIRGYSLLHLFWVVTVFGTVVGWHVDRRRMMDELRTHRILDGNMYEREKIVAETNWSANEDDVDMLVFLLTDPYPGVRVAAEQKLQHLFPSAVAIGTTRLEKINSWTSWLINEKSTSDSWRLERDREQKKNPFDF